MAQSSVDSHFTHDITGFVYSTSRDLIMYHFYFQQSERVESAQSHSPPHPETATISPTLSEDKTSFPSQASIHDVIQVINLQKVRKILSHCVTKPTILALRSVKTQITVMPLSFQTDRSLQTVQTQIILAV